MSDEPPRSPKDAHYARLRRAHRDAGRPGHPASVRPKSTPGASDGTVRLWGLHSVRAALANPRRRIRRLYVTRNALERLGMGDPAAQPFPVELVEPRAIDKLTEADAVH